MKTCCTCKLSKPIDQFHNRTSSPDGRTRFCIACQKIRNKIHYSLNKDTYKATARKSRKIRTSVFRNWKQTLQCQICACQDSECLDFHHIDSSKKEVMISSGLQEVSKQRLISELVKCVVVCANCHRKIHAKTVCVDLVPLTIDQLPTFK